MRTAAFAALVAAFFCTPALALAQVEGGGGDPICTTSVAGKCKPDGSTITVQADGTISAPSGGGGNVTGPGSSTVGHIALFDNTTGTLLSDGAIASTALATLTGAQTLTNKVINCANNTCTVRLGSDVSGTLPVANGGTGITSLGTGVATALGVNVGSAGAFVVLGGALGTPSSGVGTNLTGTAAGLTAGTVTTNANLTGPITSSGNATAIASQTGTGTKFVVDTSPTLVTPVLGVAAATSINKVALTAPATSATLTIADGKTLTDTSGTGAVALKGATGGGFAQAACGDLSNAGNGCSGTLPVAANPTGTAADVAVNGVATTFMRSDGAPAVQKGSDSAFGIVKVDGTTITATGGVITATAGGAGCTVSGGAGAVFNTGSSACTTDTSITATAGALALGASGTAGSVAMGNATSGTVKIQPVTGALGTVTLSLPAATDTLLGKATTDTLTNKTYDTAGTGNSFSINGVAATANTGTGSVARATSPTFVTPTLGVASATSVNKWTMTAPTTAATLTAGGDSLTYTMPAATSTIAGLSVNQAWTAGQAVTPTVGGNTGAATVTPDAATSNGFTYTLTGNITLANPSNVKAGQVLNFQLTQDGTGSRTIALGNQYKFASATAPTWSTGAGKIDILSCWWVTTSVGQCNAIIDVR